MMTREETQNILMSIQAAFPNYRVPDKTVTVNTWREMLSGYTYEQVSAALKAYILSDTSGFAPGIGQIVEKIQMLINPEELTEMEAWALVSMALRNSCYGAEQEFEKLPLVVQKAVGAPSQLYNWAQSDSKSVESVIQSNFMRTYRTVLNRENEISKMPAELKKLMLRDTKRISENGMQEKRDRTDGIVDNSSVPMPEQYRRRLEKMLEEN